MAPVTGIGRRGFLTSLAGIAVGSGAIAAISKDREPPKLEAKPQCPYKAEETREPWIAINLSWRGYDGQQHRACSAFTLFAPGAVSSKLLRSSPPYLVQHGGVITNLCVTPANRPFSCVNVPFGADGLFIGHASCLTFVLDDLNQRAGINFACRSDSGFDVPHQIVFPMDRPEEARIFVTGPQVFIGRHCHWKFPDHAINPFAAPAPAWRSPIFNEE